MFSSLYTQCGYPRRIKENALARRILPRLYHSVNHPSLYKAFEPFPYRAVLNSLIRCHYFNTQTVTTPLEINAETRYINPMAAFNLFPPSLADIDALARRALADIPDRLRQHAANVLIRVEDFPEEEIEKAMDLESPFDLLGLYHGVALPHKSVLDSAPPLDTVFLYRRPILDYWCETEESLESIVRHVLIHEIGHHFGFSDDDMMLLENADH